MTGSREEGVVMPRIYAASRASVPERPAMWRKLRSDGFNIISSWIDEAGPGESASIVGLWTKIEREIETCDRVVLYVESGDFPLKGALVEIGMALGMGKEVWIVAPGVEIEERSYRPIGSWCRHPSVHFCTDIRDAVRCANFKAEAAREDSGTPADKKEVMPNDGPESFSTSIPNRCDVAGDASAQTRTEDSGTAPTPTKVYKVHEPSCAMFTKPMKDCMGPQDCDCKTKLMCEECLKRGAVGAVPETHWQFPMHRSRLIIDELWTILRYRHGSAQAKDEAVHFLAKQFVAASAVESPAIADPINLFELHQKMTKHLFPAYSNTDERFLSLALAGEVGELCNMIKKRWRDSADLTAEIRDELADIRVYLELLAKCFDIEGLKLDAQVADKLRRVVERRRRVPETEKEK